MNSIQRNIILLSVMSTVGCATGPGVKSADQAAALAAPEPSYDEKVAGVALDKFKGTCPQDNKWEALEWKKISPLANACVKAKDWSKVEKMGNHLATHAHLTPWGAYYMGVAAEGRKDYPRAVWMLELALKKAPKEGIFHYEIGRIQWELGEDQEAMKHLRQASEMNPTLTEAHFVMGQVAMRRHEYSDAESYFAKALHNDNKHLNSILGMATLTIAKKDFTRAESYLSQAVSLNPKSSKARMALAQVQGEHLKKYEEALHSYKQLKQLNADKKLDESVQMNLDDKIKSLEKNIAQAAKAKEQAQVRTPSNERKVE